LPFDISSIRTLQFKRTEGGLVEVRDALIESLRAGLEGRGTRVTATRVWNELAGVDAAAVSAAVAVSNQPEETGVAEEPGFIDILAEGEVAVVEVGTVLERAGLLMEESGNLAAESKAKMDESDAHRGGFAGRLKVARDLAVDMKPSATGLEEAAAEFNAGIAKVDAMMQYVITRSSDDPAEAEEAQEFIRSALGMIDAAEESEVGVRGMLAAVVNMRKIARDLAPVSKTMERALNQFLRGIAVMVEWRSPLRNLFVEPEEGAAPEATRT